MSELTGHPRRVLARIGAAVFVLVAAVAISGCAGSAGTPLAACPDDAPTTVPGHGPDVAPLITVEYGSFWTGAWQATPSIVVYSDGSAIFRRLPDPDGDALRPSTSGAVVPPKTATPALAALAGGYLSSCDLSAVIDGIAAVDPPSGHFGMPPVSDAPGVTLRLTPRNGAATTLDAYALGINDAGKGVSAEQRAARQRLRAVLDDLDRGFHPTAAVPIDRLRVTVVTESGQTVPDEVLPWPGPAWPALLRSGRCGEVTGSAAEALAAAVPAREYFPSEHLGRWTSAGSEQTLGLVVLPPGVDGCPA